MGEEKLKERHTDPFTHRLTQTLTLTHPTGFMFPDLANFALQCLLKV